MQTSWRGHTTIGVGQMTERRPFPPSPRRLALARQAGLSAASPVLVGAIAWIGAVVAAVFLARAAADVIGAWIAAACRAADGAVAASPTGEALALDHVMLALLELAAPLVAVAAIAAFVAHVAQTRGLWLPRRRIAGAPAVEPARARHASIEIGSAVVIGATAFGWLWLTAPRLAALFASDQLLAGVAAAIGSLAVSLAIAGVAVGVLDALVRRAELAQALAMTPTEKREDDRLAAADPRWRAQRLSLARGSSTSDAVARSALV
ncbi:MAG TPA: EscU/YscU/HrcU family type III secretion system export apparatus switch protein, partial [Kofleriaceae bacterium]|nr:EscU/YscU/HrcU family type III secretion system export apparatus switch protein [Kofleriaceae bacterium]